MAKIKKGAKLACVPCGREVIVDCCGASEATLWCCGRPMAKKGTKSSIRFRALHPQRIRLKNL